MLPLLKHIIRLSLFVLLMGNLVSCQSWHDAKAVIAEADSLLAKGVIIRDTAVLARAIEALDKPITRKLAREELVKANYLMGRNLDDYHHNFSDAADFYIEADRLKTKDLILRGRINSCMGYLCKQDSCFEEALVFYERANEAFEKSGDDRRIANGLVSIAEQYVNMEEYNKADSVLSLASRYEIDSALYARMIDVKALALYNQQKYDAALSCLLEIKGYPRNIEARCYSYKIIMRCYYDIDKIDLAVPYAEYIIQKSINLNYLSSAYCILLSSVRCNSDINTLTKYSNDREDIDRLLQQLAKEYAQAADKLINYQKNAYPYRVLNFLIACIIVVCIISLWLWNKKQMKQAERETDELHAQIFLMESKQEATIQNNLQVVREKVFNNSIAFPLDSDIWKDDTKLFTKVNELYHSLFMYLRKDFNLKDHELKLILLVLLDAPNNSIAELLSYSYKSVGAMKRYVANKLGTQARNLKEFLIKYIASKSIVS